jgi:sugar/nucleoside kinase (ribokinase family)
MRADTSHKAGGMPGFDVVGLGVSTVDIVSLVDHFPTGEEIQRAEDMTIQGGGPVATAIAALARLGARTAMLDAIGDDWRGGLILAEFDRAGVSTEHIRRCHGASSATACLLVRRPDGARTIVFLPGTTPELEIADLPREVIESARALHVNGRHGQACLQACRWARQAGVLVSFDGGAGRYREEMRRLVPLSDVCIVARQFAEQYTAETDIPAALSRLRSEGPQVVAVTDGLRGSWVESQDGARFHQPAFPVADLVDTTGCGDAYHGAFLFGLLQGLRLEAVAAFASAAAALNARHLGGRAGLPTRAQVEAFLDEHAATL